MSGAIKEADKKEKIKKISCAEILEQYKIYKQEVKFHKLLLPKTKKK